MGAFGFISILYREENNYTSRVTLNPFWHTIEESCSFLTASGSYQLALFQQRSVLSCYRLTVCCWWSVSRWGQCWGKAIRCRHYTRPIWLSIFLTADPLSLCGVLSITLMWWMAAEWGQSTPLIKVWEVNEFRAAKVPSSQEKWCSKVLWGTGQSCWKR